jgi:membrane protein DedA with SNARE-associated domain
MDALIDFLLNTIGPRPYLLCSGIFTILLLCGIGLPVPEDITLFAAGLLAYYGLTDYWTTILFAFSGVIFGDLIIFALGYHFGRRLTRIWFFHRLLPDDRLDAVSVRFHRFGNKLIFVARFMPGLRAPIYFSAGTLRLPFKIFIFYDGLAALISVPTIITIVYRLGDHLDYVVRQVQRAEHVLLFVIFFVIATVLGKWYVTHRRLRRA